jgi:MraZ protein
LRLNGTYEHTLDAKNRLTLPAKCRKELSGKVVLVLGEDPCVSVHPADDYYDAANERLSKLERLSREDRDERRRLYSLAEDAEIDGAGRVTLTPLQLRHAGIDGRDVVITGVGDALELWSPVAWQEQFGKLIGR